MGGLIEMLFGKLIEATLGKGVEAAGEQVRNNAFRRIALVVVFGGAAWMAAADALLWECARLPGVHGLWQYVQEAGGPGWTLVAPGLAALMALVALLPMAGRHSLNALLAAGAFGFTLAALANFQNDGHSAVNGVGFSCAIVSIVVPIFALVLAYGDVPPLDSATAHVSLVYWGRLRHLKALRRYGQERGLEVAGPDGHDIAVRVRGLYDPEHPVRITSGAHFKLSTENQATYFVEVRMGSPRNIVAFRIGWEPAPKKLRGKAVGGELRVSVTRRLFFYVVPDSRLPIGPDFVARMARVVEAGQQFLRRGDFVQATPYGIRYYRRGPWYGMRVRDAALDSTIQWLRQLVGLLETVTPPDAAAPASQYAAAQSHGGRGGQPGRW